MFTIAINCNQTYSLEIRVSNGVRFNQCENKMSLGKTFNKFLNQLYFVDHLLIKDCKKIGILGQSSGIKYLLVLCCSDKKMRDR